MTSWHHFHSTVTQNGQNLTQLQLCSNSVRVCWVRYTHSGNYEARGASGDYEAWRASGGKYEARMVIFRILAAVSRFSRISWKEESR